ncbi:MAG TPA: hypothetical protein VHK86_02810 [Nitrososphaera sp.]|jgi:hypothetical protein|nr:hypothetical protein [Nitrososphaera sp.]
MVKFDGVKGQELLDVEKTKDELTLILKDNRYLFIKVKNGLLTMDAAMFESVKGHELVDVEENNNELKLKFKDDKLFSIKVDSGQLVVDSLPE